MPEYTAPSELDVYLDELFEIANAAAREAEHAFASAQDRRITPVERKKRRQRYVKLAKLATFALDVSIAATQAAIVAQDTDIA